MADSGEFGANDWMIELMREQYESDPGSVDPAWAQYFADAPQPTAASAPVDKPQKAKKPKKDKSQPRANRPEPTVEEKARQTTETPKAPGSASGISAEVSPPQARDQSLPTPESRREIMRGTPMRTAQNMTQSLAMPTATSVRAMPMKLVIDNRELINNFLKLSRGGKVSFTHIIGYAMVKALQAFPEMNNGYDETDGKPTLVVNPAINLGIAIDTTKKDGTRQLVVPSVKNCESLDFVGWWVAYEEIVEKARTGTLQLADFQGTTATLTNPGGIGTNHSVPRLMTGQGVIVGVGAIDYPAEFEGVSELRINELSVSKICTLTSTYDHRIIQGAQSGEFLKHIHHLLLGGDGFFEEIFQSLRIPYAPWRWSRDITAHRADQVAKQARVMELVQAYRSFGHLIADTDPLEYSQRRHPDLELETHGLTLWDMDREFAVGNFGESERSYMTLRSIMRLLRDSYCHTLGVEYTHISDREQRMWFQQTFERAREPLSHDDHLRILDKLNEAEIFETFLQTKFVGQKRFSLEGGESAIVFLAEICERAADANLEEVAIGMPHRGRLNVLTNIVGKGYGQIFREFDGNLRATGTGDVKYHLGIEGEYTAASGQKVKTSVAANPSHLEAVNPVLEGIARAKNDVVGPGEFRVLPVLLHGDAAFAGQGVVFETLQMSQLRPYTNGGTIHLVVNNQVGFTTSPVDSRSSHYATDVAKAIQAPIIHVNGDDPDAVVRAASVAFSYRQQFGKDVIIDLVCYRRRGHNEGDDPSFTQPKMYDLIAQKRSTRKIYTEALIGRGDVTTEEAEQVMDKFRERLERVFQEAREAKPDETSHQRAPYYPTKPDHSDTTAVPYEYLEAVADVYSHLPDGFQPAPKVVTQLERRAKSILEGPIDWATGELLAWGSLLMEGRPVRVVGQDSRRGTFSQRFAAVVDRVTNEAWVPLKHLTNDQATFDIFDSLLSEYAAMGFEYGYSVARPDALVCWEAQFGDFANGAQTISDEFIAAGRAKWGQNSGVVLLLPHGYEGQGPDHSSCRLERWLSLASEEAFAVCQPSTPASYFHLLRQHAYVNWHRPLVVATPKSMLRNKLAVSMPNEFTSGAWQPVMGDPSISSPDDVATILLCSGKLRWELVKERADRGLESKVAILPMERFYPTPGPELARQLDAYSHVTDVRWCQDEPMNQGAWPFLSTHLADAVDAQGCKVDLSGMRVIARPEASAPSVGLHHLHEEQQVDLLARAFEGI